MILANRRAAPWRPLWRRVLGWTAVGLLPLSPVGVRAWAEQPSGEAEVVVEAVAAAEIGDAAPKSEVTLELADELSQPELEQAVEAKFDLVLAGSAEEGNVVSNRPQEASVDRGSAPWQTVLVVDDEANIRDVVSCVLEDEGYRVLQATSTRGGKRNGTWIASNRCITH